MSALTNTIERQAFAFGNYEGELLRKPGARRLIIALTGVSDANKPYRGYEFDRSIAVRPQLDAILLRDLARSWYRCADGLAEVLALCRDCIAHGGVAGSGYDSVTVLGISMGAYGALSLGAQLPEAQVVAMSPPISLDTRRFGRTIVRHKAWLDANAHFDGTDAEITGDPSRYLILFGDEEMIDLTNLSHFVERGWPNLFVCPGGGHNLGMHLKAQGTMPRFFDLLAEGAALTELAAQTGAYRAHPDCPAIDMLRARRLLHEGDFAAARERLLSAWAGLGTPSPALERLTLLRLGLAAPLPAALEKARGLRWQGATLALGEGTALLMESSDASLPGGVLQLGPLARGRLCHGRDGPVTLSMTATAPEQPSRGGSTTLAAFLRRGDGFEQVAALGARRGTLSLPLTVQDGVAEFFLRRRCFTSAFDLGRGVAQQPWSMQLRDIRLEEA